MPLSASLAPGGHSEAQMQSLRTLGHGHLDSRRFSWTGHLWKGLKRAQSGLCHEAGQAHSLWVSWAHSSTLVSHALPLVAPPRPEPCPNPAPAPAKPLSVPVPPCPSPELSPSPESPPQLRLSHTLTPTLLLPPPPPLFHQAAHFLVLLWVLLQAAGLEAPPGLTFQVPQSVTDLSLSPSRQGR